MCITIVLGDNEGHIKKIAYSWLKMHLWLDSETYCCMFILFYLSILQKIVMALINLLSNNGAIYQGRQISATLIWSKKKMVQY